MCPRGAESKVEGFQQAYKIGLSAKRRVHGLETVLCFNLCPETAKSSLTTIVQMTIKSPVACCCFFPA